MTDEHLSYFELRLNREIALIEAKLKELQAEKVSLARQLSKARAERSGIKLVERKNSASRIMAENAVILALRNANRSLKVNDLYKVAKRTNFDLKDSTFRSYLQRMKKKGEIQSSGRSGWWSLPASKKAQNK